jgi:hypothetical protein
METLEAMRRIMQFTAACRVEDLQYITNAWIPHPLSCIVKDITIPDTFYLIAARHISENLGDDRGVWCGLSGWR